MRRGLTARVFAECEGMSDLYTWFLLFLHELQEKALLQVDKTDPTREVSGLGWHAGVLAAPQHTTGGVGAEAAVLC